MTAKILRGDVRAVLPTLADCSVQCVVTSPPYWGLRSYLPDGHPDKHLEIGSEATVDEWVAVMVAVFRETRRVLRDDGVLFLNLGDSYGPDKQLIGQPWRCAFALQADGWTLRQDIIWEKPGPMPESVRDRCTKAHEHVFLLSKSPRYFWDFNAFQEPVTGGAHSRTPGNTTHGKYAASDIYGHHQTKGGLVAHAERTRAKRQRDSANLALHPELAAVPAGWQLGPGPHGRFHRDGRSQDDTATRKARLNPKAATGVEVGYQEGKAARLAEVGVGANLVETRNPRSVWRIAAEPYKGAHYATYPRELARRCITAGSKVGDTVLDVFGGSGTTGAAADELGRDSILIDLDERNVEQMRNRVARGVPLLADLIVSAS